VRVLGVSVLVGAALVGLLTDSAVAQTGLRSASLPDRTPQQPIPQSPTVNRSASLPDRTPQRPIPPPAFDQFLAGRRSFTPNIPFQRHHRARRGFQNGFGVPLGYAYGFPYYGSDDYAAQEAVPESMPTGYLYLQLQPGSAEVFVDGLYMGTVDDFRRVIPGRALEAGPHRVEVSADGYETATFDVLVSPNETVTYRRDLARLPAPPPQAAIPPPAPKTLYVIPGCYAGDRPPKGAPLPRGCDPSKVRVIPPAVGTVARVQR